MTASGAVLHFDSRKKPAGSTFWLPARQGGRSAICASRWISPCRKRLPTQRKAGAGDPLKADFTYYQPPNRQLYGSHAPYYAEQSGVPWEFVVEDVKSKATRTAKYAMKKMLKDRFGLRHYRGVRMSKRQRTKPWAVRLSKEYLRAVPYGCGGKKRILEGGATASFQRTAGRPVRGPAFRLTPPTKPTKTDGSVSVVFRISKWRTGSRSSGRKWPRPSLNVMDLIYVLPANSTERTVGGNATHRLPGLG